MKKRFTSLLAGLLVFTMAAGMCVTGYADETVPANNNQAVVSEADSDIDSPNFITDESSDPAAEAANLSEENDQIVSEDLSSENSLNNEPVQTLDVPTGDNLLDALATEYPFDDYLSSLKVVITDANGEHVVDYKEGDSTDINLGEIQRNATLSIMLGFNPNTAAGNEDGDNNPIAFGDTFTCKVPDILSNANGGKWEGRLKDNTTNYGNKFGSIGDFTIENGKLTIAFDQGYIEETGGNIKDASLSFNGSFDAYGWDESAFEKTLYFGNLPVKVNFPAANVLRNLSIEKTPVNYDASQFSSYSNGVQGKSALNNTAKIGADGYVTYSIKVSAAEDNTSFLDNVVISDVFTTDNVDPSSVVLLSAVKGAKDTDIMNDVVAQVGTDGNITGWNVGRLNRGESATVTFKIKIDRDKITEDVDAAKAADPTAGEARLLKNTASAIADKIENPVTQDAATSVANYLQVYKSKNGNYDPATGRQKFIIRITAPTDNKYTEHDIYLRDYQSSYTAWIKEMGILGITIKHADNTETTSSASNLLYHDFEMDNAYQWHAYLDELKPGDVATISTYIDIDTDKYYTESGNNSGTNGINGATNYLYAGSGDLKASSDYASYYATKQWLYKTGTYSADDGTIQWTMTGNSYSSTLPDASIEGMTVTDTVGSNQKMVEDEVLVTFYEPNSTTVRPYTGENAKDGKLAVATTEKGFTFVIPTGFGDCKYSVTYKTKLENNYGPSYTYYNTGKTGIWTYSASTTRPRIASIDKQYVERGADWAKWQVKVLGPVKNGDAVKDSVSYSPEYNWMTDDDIDNITVTFNGKTVDKTLYKIEPTTSSTAGRNQGFTLTFLGSIADTGDDGKDITPTPQNPAIITYTSHLAYRAYNEQTYYGNSANLIVDGITQDTATDYFYRSNYPEISKKYKNTVGSDITWTISVNKNGYGCYLIDENNNPILYKNLGDGQKGGTGDGYYAIITETIPAGLKYVTAKYGNSKGSYAAVPTVTELSKTTNDDGSTTVKLLIGNLRHYEVAPNYTSTYYNTNGYYRVDIDVVTQIIDKECLLDTTDKNFEWSNSASLISMDGQPYSADATMNIAHTALTKEMKYDGSTAPNAQFTIDMNKEEFDLDPDSDTIKVFDKSSATLNIDPTSIKVIDTRDNSPVNFILDASQMAVDGTFSLEVPDNLPLRITYSAGVSGVAGEQVSVSNNAYFEGQKIEEVTSHIDQVVTVLNAEAQAQSSVMIWLHKMDAVGTVLPGCIFKLEKYTTADGWTTVNDNIVTAAPPDFGTKVSGLDKNVLYCLTETKAAENYILDETPHYFCLKVDQDSVVELPDDFTGDVFYGSVASGINVYNKPYVPVSFRKFDENDNPLPGASFKVVKMVADPDGGDPVEEPVKDKTGKLIAFSVDEEPTTPDNPEPPTPPTPPEGGIDLAELPDEGNGSTVSLPTFYMEPGTYTLKETKAPDGYLPAEDIEFTVSADGTVSVGGKRVENNTVICKDKPTTIAIRKMDGSVTPNVAIEDAVLQVLDGNTVKDEWTTDGLDHVITGVLNVGKTYTLHETTAPTGFLLADDISFSIKADGTIISENKADDGALVMVDTKPALDILKVNRKTNAALAGVSLTMTQGNTEILTWTTTTDAKHFDNLEVGTTYTITENDVPAGYVKIAPFTITPNADGTYTISGEDATYADGTLTVKNDYVPTPVDVTLTVHKQITGAPPTDKQFTFELQRAGSTDTEPQQITITGEGDADFDKLTFDEAGTYTYTISETKGTDKGYTYSTDIYTVVVDVTDDGLGTLSKKVTIDGEEVTDTEVTFENAYQALPCTATVNVEKKIEGTGYPKDTAFRFELKPEGNAPAPANSVITITGEGKASSEEITFTEIGTYEYTIDEFDDKTANFTYDNTVQKITFTVTDNDGELQAECKVNGKAADTAVFTNRYTAPAAPDNGTTPQQGKTTIQPDTGDSQTLPIGVLLISGIAIAAITLLKLKRRRA